MANRSPINYKMLVGNLIGKHRKWELYMSDATENLWLPCYRDIGRLLQKMEEQGYDLAEHLSPLSICLSETFGPIASSRFTPETLLRMKDYARSYTRTPDMVRWEATRKSKWQGCMPSNFHITLPEHIRELAQSVFKNSYHVPIPIPVLAGGAYTPKECDLEEAILSNINEIMIQLGLEFGFVRKQYKPRTDNSKHRYDLVFYHNRLKCHIIVELKRGPFKSEYIGKMMSYLQSAEKELRLDGDNPPIGILLCRKMNEEEVEQATKDALRPIGVATYHF